jgi:hypothetical protein
MTIVEEKQFFYKNYQDGRYSKIGQKMLIIRAAVGESRAVRKYGKGMAVCAGAGGMARDWRIPVR